MVITQKSFFTGFFHVLFWLLSSYFIINFFSLESEEINIELDGNYSVERSHHPALQAALSLGILLRLLFFYGHVKYISPFLFTKEYLKYTVSVIMLLLVGVVGETLIIRLMDHLIVFQSLPRILIPIYLIYFLFSLIYALYLKWQAEESGKQELKNHILKSELSALRAQFDPHFIFNTLNSLLYIAEKEGNQTISKAIEQLSSLLRSVIYDFKSPTIPLSTELMLIEKFIQLHRLKYDEKDDITIKIDFPKDLNNEIELSPLLLLPFVENAFKHGIDIYEKSEIDISANVVNNHLAFTVKNTNHSGGKSSIGGIGQKNTMRRLELLYNGHHDVNIIQNGFYEIYLNLDLNHQPTESL